MRFEEWLKTQKHRDDPIGDLAKDYIAARKMIRAPFARRSDDRHSSNIEKQLAAWDAGFHVYEVLEEAKEEYTRLFLTPAKC